ncbi:phosphoserine phosphatase SerB [Pelagibius sp. Alg239-R121]|uniref:phosphoserine phosphatase SerB n=1 Tax=Pelagibius sp. Alg239-R121 TaxID=2993448 RepID=UPI0024A6446F|nr:phosphoserine phosphatase SerB [Pelagibius sp. Alg239-R121]
MSNVLTLVAGSDAAPLLTSSLEPLRQMLSAAGASVHDADWLAPGVACDLAFEGIDIPHARETTAGILSELSADHAFQKADGRRKSLLVADMESTIIAQEMIDELAVILGIGSKIAEITTRAMAGELAFEDSLRSRVALLKDLPETQLQEVSKLMTLNPGARTLVQTMRTHGAYTALVSGGFTFFTAQIRDACGFHEDRANSLLIEEGRLTGAVAEPILGREAKQASLEEIAGQRGLNNSAVCAVGDGANDLAMLSVAGLGAAYHGKAVVREAAEFQIDHGDLSTLLYFQGYRPEEFKC